METRPPIHAHPAAYLQTRQPDAPVWFFAPAVLHRTAERFTRGFSGLVTYAVKANPDPAVLDNLTTAGITAFDVASPAEMALVRAARPDAALHYNNPVRSRAEIAAAVRAGVSSYAVDDPGELEKLAAAIPGREVEVAVRLHLPVPGAAYDFGSKFGTDPAGAAELLGRVAALGFRPAMTFHPGTQCADPAAWAAYISACAQVARSAGVRLDRLNVGGGFPAPRLGPEPKLEAIFDAILTATDAAFPPGTRPGLVCEPGRAMVAEAFTLAARVKARRGDRLYLNDGLYGGLSEAPVMGGVPAGVEVLGPRGPRRARGAGFTVFGPTCDSLDRLPGALDLPRDISEGDYILFPGLGAYGRATATRFNGYGLGEVISVERAMP